MSDVGDGTASGREWRRPGDVACLAVAGREGASDSRCRLRPNAHEGSADRRFPRRHRLRRRSDFVRIQRASRGRKSPHFTVILVPGTGTAPRLGITASRRLGSAVRRNWVKRRVREFFRIHRNKLQPAYDLLIIARAGADRLSFMDVQSELARVLGIAVE